MYDTESLIDLVKQEIEERTSDGRDDEVIALNDILSRLEQNGYAIFELNQVIWLADLVKTKTELDLE
jgi:hypothetical protein